MILLRDENEVTLRGSNCILEGLGCRGGIIFLHCEQGQTNLPTGEAQECSAVTEYFEGIHYRDVVIYLIMLAQNRPTIGHGL